MLNVKLLGPGVHTGDACNSLRWYASGTTEEIEKIISKYSDLCRKTCTRCGKPAKWVTRFGWIESYCDDCYDLEKKDED